MGQGLTDLTSASVMPDGSNVPRGTTHEQRLADLTEALKELGGTKIRGGEVHYFAHGTYGRALPMPAGARIISARHKYEHTCMLLVASIRILSEDGDADVQAPHVWVSGPGRKAIAALEDGKYGQAFPFLGGGGERRGKPIMAFCRLSEKPIRVRSRIAAAHPGEPVPAAPGAPRVGRDLVRGRSGGNR